MGARASTRLRVRVRVREIAPVVAFGHGRGGMCHTDKKLAAKSGACLLRLAPSKLCHVTRAGSAAQADNGNNNTRTTEAARVLGRVSLPQDDQV